MDISIPNENGCLAAGLSEVVAKRGHSYAAVEIALGEDGRYRFAVDLMYSYGGFGGPICADGEGFASIQDAKISGMEELLRRWPKPFPSDPQSVHEELADMRQQVRDRLRQPSLF